MSACHSCSRARWRHGNVLASVLSHSLTLSERSSQSLAPVRATPVRRSRDLRWTTPSCSRRSSRWTWGRWRWWRRRRSQLTRLLWLRWCGTSPCDGTCDGRWRSWCTARWRSPWRWCLDTQETNVLFNQRSCFILFFLFVLFFMFHYILFVSVSKYTLYTCTQLSQFCITTAA